MKDKINFLRMGGEKNDEKERKREKERGREKLTSGKYRSQKLSIH